MMNVPVRFTSAFAFIYESFDYWKVSWHIKKFTQS